MTSKMKRFFGCTLLCLGLACGPQVDGSGEEAGEEGSEPDMSWVLGFFHHDEMATGPSRGLLQMFELREDGTGEVFAEDCREGVLGPFELSWRALSEEEVEVFSPEGEPFQWIKGVQENVILTRGEEGSVRANDSGSTLSIYNRGKLCVTNRPPVGECPNGFSVEVCEG